MVPLHRPLAGYHPAGRHLGRTVDPRAFPVANVDRRSGPATRNLESGARWPAPAKSSRLDTSPRLGGSPGKCSTARELGAGSIRRVHTQVVLGTGLFRLPAGTLGRAGHPRFLARNPEWSGGALLVRAGDFGLRGVLLHWHDATAAGVPRSGRRPARWPPGPLALHHRREPDSGDAAARLAGGVRCAARGPGFRLVPRTGALRRAVQPGPLPGRGCGVRPRGAGPASIRRGIAMAWAFAIAAAGWAVSWSLRHDHRAVLGGLRLALVMGSAAVSWVVATALLLAWRRRRRHALAWVLVLATAAELGWLYYTSTTVWGWAVDLPSQSPVLAGLSAEPEMARVAGLVHDLPIRAGAAPIFPYTGLTAPPPHPDLELATRRGEAFSAAGLARLRRYGVTHGIWDGPVDQAKAKAATLLECADPVLDRLVYKPPGAPGRARWRLVRYPEPFPAARAAIRVRFAAHERALLSGVSFDPDIQAVWYRAVDQPPASAGPIATIAKVISWDGRTAFVEHDGTCDLVINRTYYPGWFASVN